MGVVKDEIDYLVERHLKHDWAVLISIYVLATIVYIISAFIVSFVSVLLGDIIRWFWFSVRFLGK